MKLRRFAWLMAISVGPGAALAQFDSGSDGSDGQFFPVVNTTIDLSRAATASWDTPSPVPGRGVYDPQEWAVVFKYTTINVPAGVTVTFLNHPKGAPLVWLAQGDVTINGSVNLDGAVGMTGSVRAKPGPGGFAGGLGSFSVNPASAGQGPGGASTGLNNGVGGSHATLGSTGGCEGTQGPIYGNDELIPLIGGSGGSGSQQGRGGGAGAGAILLASSTRIELNGNVLARGGAGSGGSSSYGGGGGSGGGVRFIAPELTGTGLLLATGGAGGVDTAGFRCSGGGGSNGRIRLEADALTLTSSASPPATCGTPRPVFPPANAPSLRVVRVAGQAVPQDPDAGILSADVAMNDSDNPAVIEIEANNIPTGNIVHIRIIPEQGTVIELSSTPLFGSMAFSTATAQVELPQCRSEIQLKANWEPR